MPTKLHPIVREFLLLKFKILKSVMFVKVEAHQHDVKSFDELSFLDQLNIQCDARAKALMLNVFKKMKLFHFH